MLSTRIAGLEVRSVRMSLVCDDGNTVFALDASTIVLSVSMIFRGHRSSRRRRRSSQHSSSCWIFVTRFRRSCFVIRSAKRNQGIKWLDLKTRSHRTIDALYDIRVVPNSKCQRLEWTHLAAYGPVECVKFVQSPTLCTMPWADSRPVDKTTGLRCPSAHRDQSCGFQVPVSATPSSHRSTEINPRARRSTSWPTTLRSLRLQSPKAATGMAPKSSCSASVLKHAFCGSKSFFGAKSLGERSQEPNRWIAGHRVYVLPWPSSRIAPIPTLGDLCLARFRRRHARVRAELAKTGGSP